MNSLEALIPEMIEPARALVQVANENGLQPRITSTLRTRTEQEKLYRRYLSGVSRYPVAPPGASAHEYGLAFDMVVFNEQYLQDLGQVWASWGGVWHPSDPIHFEYPGFSVPRNGGSAGPERVPSGVATVGDFLLNFVPVIGDVSTVASLAQMFGVSHSWIVEFLSSPMSTVNRDYPGVLQMVALMFGTRL